MDEKNTKVTSNRSIKLVVIVALLIALIILIPIGYALFSDHKNDSTSAKIGKIEVILQEDWPDYGDLYEEDVYDEFGIKKYTKDIWGHSTGDLPAYVRVRCIPVVEYYDEAEDKWITAPVSQENIVISVNSEDESGENVWVNDGEYWYYTKIVPAGADTEKMSFNWQVVELPTGLSGKDIRTDVRVMLEYAQTTHDMWKDIFQIENLPDGVEAAEE